MKKNKKSVHNCPVEAIMNTKQYSGAIMNSTVKYQQYLEFYI
jgi:hypothetical protein